jgi:large subunit ribosomal protein L5e
MDISRRLSLDEAAKFSTRRRRGDHFTTPSLSANQQQHDAQPTEPARPARHLLQPRRLPPLQAKTPEVRVFAMLERVLSQPPAPLVAAQPASEPEPEPPEQQQPEPEPVPVPEPVPEPEPEPVPACGTRLVVRISNAEVTCQVVRVGTGAGDAIVCAAYSSELRRHGLEVGLTNWSAAYCTGLLCACRLFDMVEAGDLEIQPDETPHAARFEARHARWEAQQPYYEQQGVRVPDEPREHGDFYCTIDTGLAGDHERGGKPRPGARCLAALKGAVDGSFDIPHGDDVLVGFDEADRDLDMEVLTRYIVGGHVSEYMDELAEEDPELYEKQFSKYIAAGIEPGELECVYKSVHAKIRENPGRPGKQTPVPKSRYPAGYDPQYWGQQSGVSEQEALMMWREHTRDSLAEDVDDAPEPHPEVLNHKPHRKKGYGKRWRKGTMESTLTEEERLQKKRQKKLRRKRSRAGRIESERYMASRKGKVVSGALSTA